MNVTIIQTELRSRHDDVIKWKYFPRYCPFMLGIHRSPVKSPHKGQWRGGMMLSLICAWINDWVNNREAGDPRSHRAHYDVIVMVARGNISLVLPYILRQVLENIFLQIGTIQIHFQQYLATILLIPDTQNMFLLVYVYVYIYIYIYIPNVSFRNYFPYILIAHINPR